MNYDNFTPEQLAAQTAKRKGLDGAACSASLIPHFTFKDYNGGEMREWRIFCKNGCGGEGFYRKTKAECAEQAWAAGWRVFSGKPQCNNCMPNRYREAIG